MSHANGHSPISVTISSKAQGMSRKQAQAWEANDPAMMWQNAFKVTLKGERISH